MISDDFQQRIKKYNDLDWKSLTREDTFAEASNFSMQRELFNKTKEIFDILLKNIDVLSSRLPEGHLQQINSQLQSFLTLVDRINAYSDVSKHKEMVEDIKRTSFEIQDGLTKYIEYLDIDPKEKVELLKKEFKRFDDLEQEVRDAVSKEMEKLKKGVEKTSEGKIQIAGDTFSQFFANQAEIHKKNAEGDGQVTDCRSFFLCKIKNNKTDKQKSIGWLQIRANFNVGIMATIILALATFVASYIFVLTGLVEKDVWRMFWDIRVGILLVALLTSLYTGMYFATKNYNREKDLEYENMNKANVAKTMLVLSANSSDSTEAIIISEAAKTLFSTIKSSERKKDGTGSQSMNISVPTQGIPQMLNGDVGK